MKDVFICKRLRLLEYLIKKGHEAIGTQPDVDNPYYKNWIFENNDKLTADLEYYFNYCTRKSQKN